MAEKVIEAQTDWSGGQVDASAKRRADSEVVKTGARIMTNLRAMKTGAATCRPGRLAVAPLAGARTEQFRIAGSEDFLISFAPGEVSILTTTCAVVASNTSASYLWNNSTIGQICYAVLPTQIVITFPGMQPQLITFNAAANSWSFSAFTFATIQSQVQEPFYRFSVPGATMSPSGQTGSITLTCSQPYFTNSMIGRRLSILGQQVTITAVGSATPITTATATVANKLPDVIGWTIGPAGGLGSPNLSIYALNQVVEGAQTARKGEVILINTSTNTVGAALMDSVNYYGTVGALTNETLVSPLGQAPAADSNYYAWGPSPAIGGVVQWQEEFMGSVQGWPASCFYDQDRLGFCDFPQSPNAILWSAAGAYDVFWIDSTATQSGSAAAGASANSAILEFMSDPVHVRYVLGDWGQEFVFTDLGVYIVPISTGAPLTPGNVQFVKVSDDGCGTIKPAFTREAIMFLNLGTNRVAAVIRTGSITTPYAVQDVTEFHTSLLTGPICIAVSDGDGQIPERYVYVLNSDGSMAVGKYNEPKTFVGWVPWTSAGHATWISAKGANVWYTTLYGSTYILEQEAFQVYVDCCLRVNNLPPAMVKAGYGPMWMFPSSTVRVIDTWKDYGTVATDSLGNILWDPSMDHSSVTLMAGASWTETLQPFTPEVPGGSDEKQRQRRRRISRAVLSVQDSNGFTWGGRDIPPYNWNDDVDNQPTLREDSYPCRLLGRAYDPTVTFIKSAPGPVIINEISIEATT